MNSEMERVTKDQLKRIEELTEDNIKLRRRLRELAEHEAENLAALSKIATALRELWGEDIE